MNDIKSNLIARYYTLRRDAHLVATDLIGNDPLYRQALETLRELSNEGYGRSSYDPPDRWREACVAARIALGKVLQLRELSGNIADTNGIYIASPIVFEKGDPRLLEVEAAERMGKA